MKVSKQSSEVQEQVQELAFFLAKENFKIEFGSSGTSLRASLLFLAKENIKINNGRDVSIANFIDFQHNK
jgi:hypothetical protein